MTTNFSPMRLTTLFICFFLFTARAKAQDFTSLSISVPIINLRVPRLP